VKAKSANNASRISLVVALVLAAVLLYFAFRGADWATLLNRLAKGQLDILALAFLTFSCSYFLRGLRWRLLLSGEKLIAPLTVFWAIVVGYLGNNFLPARAGELIRSGLLARKTGLSMSFVLATALVERLLDAVALVLISSVAIATLPSMPSSLVGATHVLAVLALLALAFFIVVPRLEKPIQALLARIFTSDGLRTRLSGLLQQFLLGLRAFQHPLRGAGFAGLTAIIWLADSTAMVLVAHAFDLSLSLAQALVLIAALGLASSAPSTPGYVGIFQFVAVAVLVPFGFSKNDALAFILASQAVIYLVSIVWGLLGLWALRSASAPSPAVAQDEAAVEAGVR
jgi:uncharacterized protein (TIRG00374 family)